MPPPLATLTAITGFLRLTVVMVGKVAVQFAASFRLVLTQIEPLSPAFLLGYVCTPATPRRVPPDVDVHVSLALPDTVLSHSCYHPILHVASAGAKQKAQALITTELALIGGMVRPAGLEPAACGLGNRRRTHATPSAANTSDNADSVSAICLAKLRQNRPDLAAVIEAWDRLPPAVRQGILAMARTAPESDAKSA